MIGIYGANGFIGKHLLRRLIQSGSPIRAVSRHFDPDFRNDHRGLVDFIEADFQDPIAMGASLHDVDVVVQLVSSSSPGMSTLYNVSDIQENVIPHVDFLRSCVERGVRKYIFISSGGTVYGPTTDIPIREDSPTNPISSYGLTKLMVEKYLQMHGHVDLLNFVILRLANSFGPGQQFKKDQGLIPALLDRHARGLPIRIFGKGQSKRDYIFIDDVIDAIHASIEAEAACRTIINVGSGEGLSVLDVINKLEAVAGITFSREYVPARKTDVDTNILSISRARSVLGWVPKTTFRKGLKRTLDAHQIINL